jgi:hypothetical protein
MLGILLSLGSFPWDLLRQNAVFQVLTFSMQSPAIFMIPAICGLTFIGCGLLNAYREGKSATEATILDYIKMVQKPRKIKVFRGFLIPKWADIV